MKLSLFLVAVLIALSGIFFGSWPILMNNSRIVGFSYPAAYCLMTTLIVLPFAIWGDKSSVYSADWKFVLAAGLAGGIGIIAFSYLAANSKPQDFNLFFIMTLVVQSCVPAVYQAVITRKFPAPMVVGLIAACIAIVSLGFSFPKEEFAQEPQEITALP